MGIYFKEMPTIEDYEAYIDGNTALVDYPNVITIEGQSKTAYYNAFPYIKMDVHTFDNEDNRGLKKY